MSNPASRRARALRSSMALHQMKSSMSGWSALRMTILAARRVLPPDLIVPADASAPRMNDTGPALEDRPLLVLPVEDRVHRVVDVEDEAGARLLRHALDADVEPHRAVE